MQERYMNIKQILNEKYGSDVSELSPMTTGVGGETYMVHTSSGKYIFKIADANEMNHPEAEPEICDYLSQRDIQVADFRKNKLGDFVTMIDDKRVAHIYRYVDGKSYAMNTAPEWLIREMPVLLGRIHNALRDYKQLPVGIGRDFFKYMTPDNAKQSYLSSYEMAKELGDESVLKDLEFRIKAVTNMSGWEFNLDKLTCCNTHGDYTINQIICVDDRINAVIDWTSACMHPVIWEITRSFYLAEPTCRDGSLDVGRFKDYVEAYCSQAPLTEYDKDNLLRLYYYQLGVCDYYSQYLYADDDRKEEYLQQARFATKVLRNMVN